VDFEVAEDSEAAAKGKEEAAIGCVFAVSLESMKPVGVKPRPQQLETGATNVGIVNIHLGRFVFTTSIRMWLVRVVSFLVIIAVSVVLRG